MPVARNTVPAGTVKVLHFAPSAKFGWLALIMAPTPLGLRWVEVAYSVTAADAAAVAKSRAN